MEVPDEDAEAYDLLRAAAQALDKAYTALDNMELNEAAAAIDQLSQALDDSRIPPAFKHLLDAAYTDAARRLMLAPIDPRSL